MKEDIKGFLAAVVPVVVFLAGALALSLLADRMSMKDCALCGENKTDNEFTVRRGMVVNVCDDCVAELVRERIENGK